MLIASQSIVRQYLQMNAQGREIGLVRTCGQDQNVDTVICQAFVDGWFSSDRTLDEWVGLDEVLQDVRKAEAEVNVEYGLDADVVQGVADSTDDLCWSVLIPLSRQSRASIDASVLRCRCDRRNRMLLTVSRSRKSQHSEQTHHRGYPLPTEPPPTG
jgi:hypothetical protein